MRRIYLLFQKKIFINPRRKNNTKFLFALLFFGLCLPQLVFVGYSSIKGESLLQNFTIIGLLILSMEIGTIAGLAFVFLEEMRNEDLVLKFGIHYQQGCDIVALAVRVLKVWGQVDGGITSAQNFLEYLSTLRMDHITRIDWPETLRCHRTRRNQLEEEFFERKPK